MFEKFDLLLNYLTEDEKRPKELERLLGMPTNPREVAILVHEAKSERCQAEAELTQLRAEVERLKHHADTMEYERDQLEAEVERLLESLKRYGYLEYKDDAE